jgi:hypothetical protein
MRIIKINKCLECPYSEKLFPNKQWSSYVCTYFEMPLNIEDVQQIPVFCQLEVEELPPEPIPPKLRTLSGENYMTNLLRKYGRNK